MRTAAMRLAAQVILTGGEDGQCRPLRQSTTVSWYRAGKRPDVRSDRLRPELVRNFTDTKP